VRAGRSSASVHAPLGVFLDMSRRRLAIGTVLLSMALIVINDLPAVASTLPEPVPVAGVGQELTITDATLAASTSTLPLETSRDAFALSYYTPIQYPVNPGSPISSYFGHRASPCPGCSTQHSGVDFTPGYGTPVHAIADGVAVSRPMSGWGSYVVLQHQVDGQIVFSGYAHMISGSTVPVGTVVKRGDVIGRVGNTGESSGTHLHFSIIRGDTFIEPLSWLRAHVTEPFAG
jgi:murein DD-endopeptidase MepM/ murein hydrolase activator NlpD